MHFHVLWKDTRGEVRVLCVQSRNAESAEHAARDYLGSDVARIVRVVAVDEIDYARCDADYLLKHLDKLRGETLSPRQRSLREAVRMPGQVLADPKSVDRLEP